jgi:hypothetical protein
MQNHLADAQTVGSPVVTTIWVIRHLRRSAAVELPGGSTLVVIRKLDNMGGKKQFNDMFAIWEGYVIDVYVLIYWSFLIGWKYNFYYSYPSLCPE